MAKTLLFHWISRFGVLNTVTTDRGRQFESDLFKSMAKLLGLENKITTAYHPQVKGMIERQHRTIKSSLKCHILKDKNWVG